MDKKKQCFVNYISHLHSPETYLTLIVRLREVQLFEFEHEYNTELCPEQQITLTTASLDDPVSNSMLNLF